MNKLQKLFESKIWFEIAFVQDEWVLWLLHLPVDVEPECGFESNASKSMNGAIEDLWQAAKKHYPDAPCFNEEK